MGDFLGATICMLELAVYLAIARVLTQARFLLGRGFVCWCVSYFPRGGGGGGGAARGGAGGGARGVGRRLGRARLGAGASSREAEARLNENKECLRRRPERETAGQTSPLAFFSFHTLTRRSYL